MSPPLRQVKTLAEEVGVNFLGVGFDPVSRTEDVPIMPKARYDIMRAYMPTVGTMGLHMMLRSTTIQVGCASEALPTCGRSCGDVSPTTR